MSSSSPVASAPSGAVSAVPGSGAATRRQRLVGRGELGSERHHVGRAGAGEALDGPQLLRVERVEDFDDAPLDPPADGLPGEDADNAFDRYVRPRGDLGEE